MSSAGSNVDYFGISIPYMEFVGLQPQLLAEDFCRTFLPIRCELVNSRGEMHGGTMMSVLDFTMSAAARSHAPTEYGVATIEMSTHFMESARGDIVIEARCVRRGRSIAFCDGIILDAATGRQIVIARGTFKLIPGNRRSGT